MALGLKLTFINSLRPHFGSNAIGAPDQASGWRLTGNKDVLLASALKDFPGISTNRFQSPSPHVGLRGSTPPGTWQDLLLVPNPHEGKFSDLRSDIGFLHRPPHTANSVFIVRFTLSAVLLDQLKSCEDSAELFSSIEQIVSDTNARRAHCDKGPSTYWSLGGSDLVSVSQNVISTGEAMAYVQQCRQLLSTHLQANLFCKDPPLNHHLFSEVDGTFGINLGSPPSGDIFDSKSTKVFMRKTVSPGHQREELDAQHSSLLSWQRDIVTTDTKPDSLLDLFSKEAEVGSGQGFEEHRIRADLLFNSELHADVLNGAEGHDAVWLTQETEKLYAKVQSSLNHFRELGTGEQVDDLERALASACPEIETARFLRHKNEKSSLKIEPPRRFAR